VTSDPAIRATAEYLARVLAPVQLPIAAWEEIAEKAIRTYAATPYVHDVPTGDVL
jgi:hypothetical protein